MRRSIRVVYPRLMRPGPFALPALALCVLLARPARAQVIGEAVELERAGRQAPAAVVYMAVLRGGPTNLPALLWLQRAPPPLRRPPPPLPPLRRGPPAPAPPHA